MRLLARGIPATMKRPLARSHDSDESLRRFPASRSCRCLRRQSASSSKLMFCVHAACSISVCSDVTSSCQDMSKSTTASDVLRMRPRCTWRRRCVTASTLVRYGACSHHVNTSPSNSAFLKLLHTTLKLPCSRLRRLSERRRRILQYSRSSSTATAVRAVCAKHIMPSPLRVPTSTISRAYVARLDERRAVDAQNRGRSQQQHGQRA